MELTDQQFKYTIRIISFHISGNMIGGTVTKWLIVCKFCGVITNGPINGLHQKITTFIDKVDRMYIGLNLLYNNGTKEGKWGLIVSHLNWLPEKEKKYQIQNYLLFTMENDTKLDLDLHYNMYWCIWFNLLDGIQILIHDDLVYQMSWYFWNDRWVIIVAQSKLRNIHILITSLQEAYTRIKPWTGNTFKMLEK